MNKADELAELGLSEQAVNQTLIGDRVMVIDPRTGYEERARYIVAGELSRMAGEARHNGRPDRAGLMSSIASRVRLGQPVSNRQALKARRELNELTERLVGRDPRAEIRFPIL